MPPRVFAHTSFYQIVSTFIKSLDIPWPASFSVAMARVSVINLNLIQLPKAVRMLAMLAPMRAHKVLLV